MALDVVNIGRWRGTGAVVHGPSTASRARSMWARCPAEPSPSTIAPARWQPHVGAMVAIVRGTQNADETQHRPEHAARTDAPGHTRTALPGSPTGRRRKDVPVRRHPEHEDENGIAAAVSCVTDGANDVWDVYVDMLVEMGRVPCVCATAHVRALRIALHESIHPATILALTRYHPPFIPTLPSIDCAFNQHRE